MIGRQLETPRPLKSNIKQQISMSQHQNVELNTIEDLISLIENIAQSLTQGDVSVDLFNRMFSSLSLHGTQLEVYSKEILDRCFIIFRNASQDDRLKISIRLNLLNLIELRANSWHLSDGLNSYYKQKAATNVEADNELGTSSLLNMGMPISLSLSPGELVKNSGKFSKPTKIPGKSYSKDEIIIRNSDSGKVMGIKGRRVHIIEEMSSCVVSFQRVNPGAKERLVQITGPNEESINYAKILIEDTIKRNASPIREASQEGSCSSLASSDDQPVAVFPRPRVTPAINQHNSNNVQPILGSKLTRSTSHNSSGYLTHSLSTNDASLGEYKYTVNVGSHSLKITGDSLDLVMAAKLVLDDYFTQDNFMKSSEFTTPNADTISLIDSGVNLDLLAHSPSNVLLPSEESLDIRDGETMIEASEVSDPQNSSSSGLCRSRRSHFSRKDTTPELPTQKKNENAKRIVHTISELWWFYQNLPLCKKLPNNIETIREKTPAIIRDQTPNESDALRYSSVDKFLEKHIEHEMIDEVDLDDDE